MKHLALILFFAVGASAQIFPSRASKFRVVPSTPATCSPGDVAFVIGDQTKVCNTTDTWTNIGASGAGSGDVTGPASSTNNNIVLMNGTTGKAIKDGGKGVPSGAIVGTTDTQTLTGKTITAPIVTSYTVATLPGSPTAGMIAPVTDAATAGSCTSGGGSAKSLCRYSGSAWESIGDGGSGGGGGLSDGCTVTATSTTVTVNGTSTPKCYAYIGSVRYELAADAVYTKVGTPSADLFVFISTLGSTAQVTFGAVAGVGGTSNGNGTVQVLASSGFPDGVYPIAQVPLNGASAIGTPVDKRSPAQVTKILPGTGLGETINADGSKTMNVTASYVNTTDTRMLVTCSDAGANDTYACTPSPAPASYTTGGQYLIKVNTANTGAATVNINSLGAKDIKKMSGNLTTDLATGDLCAGQWVMLVYNGTNMMLDSPPCTPAASATVAPWVSQVSLNQFMPLNNLNTSPWGIQRWVTFNDGGGAGTETTGTESITPTSARRPFGLNLGSNSGGTGWNMTRSMSGGHGFCGMLNAVQSGKKKRIWFYLKTQASITSMRIAAGCWTSAESDPFGTSPGHMVRFYYNDGASANWRFQQKNASLTDTDTGLAVATNTDYLLAAEFDGTNWTWTAESYTGSTGATISSQTGSVSAAQTPSDTVWIGAGVYGSTKEIIVREAAYEPNGN